MCGLQRLPRRTVNDVVDGSWNIGVGKPLRGAGETEAAMTARLFPELPEVADEIVHLTAFTGDELEDSPDPGSFDLLAPVEASDEPVEQLVGR